MNNHLNFADKAVIVTGGGKGIGKGISAGIPLITPRINSDLF